MLDDAPREDPPEIVAPEEPSAEFKPPAWEEPEEDRPDCEELADEVLLVEAAPVEPSA